MLLCSALNFGQKYVVLPISRYTDYFLLPTLILTSFTEVTAELTAVQNTNSTVRKGHPDWSNSPRNFQTD